MGLSAQVSNSARPTFNWAQCASIVRGEAELKMLMRTHCLREVKKEHAVVHNEVDVGQINTYINIMYSNICRERKTHTHIFLAGVSRNHDS